MTQANGSVRPPLLELRDARIDCAGRVLFEAISLASSGERIGLSGALGGVVEALLGTAQLTAGQLLLDGVELEQARVSRLFGSARPWPQPTERQASVTLSEGLRYSAMLAGARAGEAKRLTSAALETLGLSHLASFRLTSRPSVERHLAGLAEAALFEPELVVVDWPIGSLSAEGWGRYGTALSRLLSGRRWLARVPGPARLPVEGAWLGSLDQLLHSDGELTAELGSQDVRGARTLVVLDADPAELDAPLSTLGLPYVPAKLRVPEGQRRAAFVVFLPRDALGRPSTEAVLSWCDEQDIPILRLEPLEIQC